MQVFSAILRCIGFCAVAVFPTWCQGQLWIVDNDGGPGVDFTTVQPAIDAAASGDTILLRAGNYGSFLIDGKGVRIIEDEGSGASVGEVTVANITAAQSVALRGFRSNHMLIESCSGPVHVENVGTGSVLSGCSLIGSPSTGGLEIMDSTEVTLARCSFAGADAEVPGTGIRVIGSTVHAYEVSAVGGKPTGSGGSAGGTGIHVLGQSFLFASGCSFYGGCGADAYMCTVVAGSGGVGMINLTASPVYLLEVALQGGHGGKGGSCSPDGPMGWGQIGSATLVAGYARDYAIYKIGPAGGTVSINYGGVAGDLVFSLVALSQDPIFLLNLAGSLTLALPPILIGHGVADASGSLDTTVPLPALPPGIEAFTVYTQGAAVSPVGAAVLAAPSVLTIL